MSRMSFKANFLALLGGTVSAQLILLAAIPLLSRVYTPTAFGQVALYSALLQVLCSVCTLKFDWLVPNASSLAEAQRLLAASVVFLAGYSLAVAVLFATTENLVYLLYDVGFLKQAGLLVVAGVLAKGVHQTLSGWLVMQSRLGSLGGYKIWNAAAYLAAALAWGTLRPGEHGLVYATLIASWVGFLAIPRSMWRELITSVRHGLEGIPRTLGENWRRGSISSTVALVNSLSATAPLLILSRYFTEAQLGVYFLVLRVVATPLGMLTSAFAQSYWSHAASLVREGLVERARTTYLRTLLQLAAGSALLAVVVYAAAPLMPLVFGPSWAGSERVVVALIPMFFGMAVTSPTNHLVALDRQHLQIVVDVLRVVLIAAAVWFTSSGEEAFLNSIWAISLSFSVCNIALVAAHLIAYRRVLAERELSSSQAAEHGRRESRQPPTDAASDEDATRGPGGLQ